MNNQLVLLFLCFLLCQWQFGCQSQQGEKSIENASLTDAVSSKGTEKSSSHKGDGDQDDSKQVKRVVEIRSKKGNGTKGVTRARYVTRFLDPVLEEIRKRDLDWQDAQSAKTAEIRKRQKAEKEKKRLEKLRLVSSLPADQIPPSPDSFHQIAHLPPVAQYYTGTCWSFSTTSFLESEVIRQTGQRIKLAEMAPVYFEYLAKARRYLDERGDSVFGEGSEGNAVLRMIKRHGAWPESAYPGVTAKDGRHDHLRLFREAQDLLESLKAKDMWDVESGTKMLRVLLDRTLGTPPEHFEWKGKQLDSKAFLHDVLRLDPDAYVAFVSTLKKPFYKSCEFEVPDNWWHDKSYKNLPLDEFYGAFLNSVKAGYGVVLGVDVSEPGKDGLSDVMFVPDYDISPERIDQLSRELRIYNGTTTDDHGVHVVGWMNHAGHDWFLIKDSGRSARRGRFKGYYFVRDDYIKLKVLSFMVHRDAVVDVLKKIH